MLSKIFPCKQINRKLYNHSLIWLNKLVKKRCLNIGGGPYFMAIGWLNLEEVKSYINSIPFKLEPCCEFPVKSSSMKIVYTSHCLEHLGNDTIKTILSEALRVLEKNGKFVVKVPDFDLVLDSWRNNDTAFFASHQWVDRPVLDTWKNRNINDCLDYRAAMFFCGFYNSAYGDLFGTNVAKDKRPYHGPPVVSAGFLRELALRATPYQISTELSKIVMQNEKDYHFNHRNAWSQKEFKQLLDSAGFRVVTFDKELILNECRDISGIAEMKEESMYCLARKSANKVNIR